MHELSYVFGFDEANFGDNIIFEDTVMLQGRYETNEITMFDKPNYLCKWE